LGETEGAIDALEKLEKVLLSRADRENCDNYTAILLRFTDEDTPILERINATEEMTPSTDENLTVSENANDTENETIEELTNEIPVETVECVESIEETTENKAE
jgi:hypothetical protein